MDSGDSGGDICDIAWIPGDSGDDAVDLALILMILVELLVSWRGFW